MFKLHFNMYIPLNKGMRSVLFVGYVYLTFNATNYLKKNRLRSLYPYYYYYISNIIHI